MGIKEYLFGKSCVSDDQQINNYKEEKVDDKVSFESDKELLERKRAVKINNEVIGFLVKEDGRYLWKQIGDYPIEVGVLSVITEKLKELGGGKCTEYARMQSEAYDHLRYSDAQLEIRRMEDRLKQLEMLNSPHLTRQQTQDIINEIKCINKRLRELI